MCPAGFLKWIGKHSTLECDVTFLCYYVCYVCLFCGFKLEAYTASISPCTPQHCRHICTSVKIGVVELRQSLNEVPHHIFHDFFNAPLFFDHVLISKRWPELRDLSHRRALLFIFSLFCSLLVMNKHRRVWDGGLLCTSLP